LVVLVALAVLAALLVVVAAGVLVAVAFLVALVADFFVAGALAALDYPLPREIHPDVGSAVMQCSPLLVEM
jgi:hypothetical protein